MKRSIIVVGVLVAAMAVAAVQADDHVPFTDKDLETEESMWNLYERWRAVYASSSSGDLADKVSRFEVFKENARYIHESNKKEGMTYKLGLNQFSDMTMEEFTAKYTGARPGPRISSGSEPLPAVGDDCCVPESWDWRNYGAVTPVKNQGPCGSCWDFSVVGAVEGIYKIKKGKLLTLSEQQVLDCSGAGDCNGGYTYYAFDYAIKTGITVNGTGNPPYYPPYEAKKDKCRFDPNKPPIVKISGKSFVPYGDEEALKRAVYRQPVSVLIEASRDFQSYSGGVFMGSCGTALNHAVLVVGYGKVHHGPRYWIVKNSWNTTWGENGYIRMARDIDFEEGICGIATYAMYPTGIVGSPADTVATY